MSAVDRVVDYMSGLPQAAEHAVTYATQFSERIINSGIREVDGVAEEKKLIPKGERELISRLHCPAKFTKNGFRGSVKLGVSVAGGRNGTVRRSKTVDLDFCSGRDWWLEPSRSRAMYSLKESTLHLLDEAQKRKIMAKCPNMTGADNGGIYMVGVHERISIPSDMRHLYMKMVLMLNDYNLAVVSKCDGFDEAEGLQYQVQRNATPQDRLAAVVNHDIVLDAESFTPEELGLLALAGESYPSVWYAGDNIYNRCHMEPDDLLIISDGDVEVDTAFTWGSPDRMYQMMWTIAAKLDTTACLVSALENLRGKCKMASSLFSKVQGNRLNSNIPLSYNQFTAFGGVNELAHVHNMPGYISSSMGLVTDLLYGMSFEAVATCVAESLGACGRLLSSATPQTNKVINGILRDYGLQHTSAEDNFLLQNWEIMAGRPITWEFGIHLKEYIICLGQSIVNGVDILLPQLLLTIPSLRAINTAYGLARGWQGPHDTIDGSKMERALDSDGLASLSWLMGQRPVRPPVFYNRVGKRPNSHGATEHFLESECDGTFGVATVGFWIEDTLGGRVDENEETASQFYRTEYAGTTCALVYSYQLSKWVMQEKSLPPARQTLTGTMPPAEPEPTVEVLQGVNWGAGRSQSGAEAFKHLKTLSRMHQVRPSDKPRHVRASSMGEAVVGAYVLDGAEGNILIPARSASPVVGQPIQYGVISAMAEEQNGVNAVVEDLKVHGLMAAGDAMRVHNAFGPGVKAFREPDELAAICAKWQMGLDVMKPDTGEFTRYKASDPTHHTVTVVAGEHGFLAAAIGAGDEQMEVKTLTLAPEVPQEKIEAIKQFGLFGDL